MKEKVVFKNETTHYAVYESAEMDFRIKAVKVRLWIPKTEIQTNIPGVYPPEITVKILDDSAQEYQEAESPR